MTAFPAAATFTSDDGQTEGEFRQACDDFLAATRQLIGAAGVESLTIATGSVTPTRGTVTVDTEAAASTDRLSNIATTNLPDGSLLLLKITDNGRVVTVGDTDGGAGQIALAGSLDFEMNRTEQQLLLQRIGTDWQEVARFGREKTHTVGDSGEPAFTNSWTASTPVPAFWKDTNGVVRLSGIASKASVAVGNSAIFTLPAGYRPSATITAPAMGAWTATVKVDYLQITSAGVVSWFATSGTPATETVNIGLNSVTFRAEA